MNLKRHIITGDVLLLVPSTPSLSVGEEFRLFRVERKKRLAVGAPTLGPDPVLEEFDEEPSRERRCGKFCTLCAQLPHRVQGARCSECGTVRGRSA